MRSRLAEALFTLLVIALFLATFSVARVFAEGAAQEGAPEQARTEWDGKFRLGPLELDPQVRVESDWRRSDFAGDDLDQEAFGLSSKRVGVDGQLGKRFGFEISAEFTSSSPWRDVRAQYTLPWGLTVTGGQFKVPLGLDGTKGALERDFVFRSRLADAFSMGRDQGASIEAKLWRKRITIEGGAFSGHGGARSGDGVGMSVRSDVKTATGLTGVVRATVSPFSRTKGAFKDLRVGVSAASSTLEEGRSDLALRSAVGEDLTDNIYWARGTRQRAGFDLRWRPGPFSTSAEFLAIADERIGQGNRNQNLTPFAGSAWYAEGTWLVTGERKVKDLRPRRSVVDGGPGAIELVLRTERATLGTSGIWQPLAASPRAERPASSQLRATTAGLNWYPASRARLQFNLTRERLFGASTTALEGMPSAVAIAVRLQLFL